MRLENCLSSAQTRKVYPGKMTEYLIAAQYLLRSEHCFNLVLAPKASEWSEKVQASTCLHQQEEPAAQGVVTTACYEKQLA
jgi:hypothetical protein